MSEIAREGGRPRFSLVRALVPNPAVGALIVAGLTLELAFVFLAAPSLPSTDFATRLFAVSYLIWFWVTAGWVLLYAGRGWQKISEKKSLLSRIVWRGLMLLFLILGVLLYALSWGLMLRTGRLASIESIRFLFFNFSHLWDYCTGAEPVHLVIIAGLAVACLILLPLLLHVAADVRYPVQRGQRIATWLALTVLTLTCWNSIPLEESSLRRGNRRQALLFELHPSFTYLSSYWMSQAEKIEADIDTRRLRPIADPVATTHVRTSDAQLPSVILIAVESLRHDTIDLIHQNQEVLPNINQLASAGVQFTQAYAQSTHSDYADVCIVSSLYPLRTRTHHYYSETDPWPRTLIYDLLKPLGYATAIISSQNEAWGGMEKFLRSPNLDLFYHPETAADGEVVETSTMDPGFSREVRLGTLKVGKFTDQHTTSQAIQWVRDQVQQDKPYFLSMNLQSSHFPYLIPDSCPRPFQPCDLNSTISFVDYPESETPKVRNAYFNAIHECDKQIGRLMDELKRLGKLDDTIVIVTGENGEAFHECGGKVGHAREPVEPAIHVACVVHAPQLLDATREAYPLEHIDLMPTLLGLLQLPAHPNFQGIDVFAADRPLAEDRYTFTHVNSGLASGDAIMVGGRWKLWFDRHEQRPWLFDTWNDPNEEHDLSESRPELLAELDRALRDWRSQQLAYYHLPQYYLSYYPPMPPTRAETITGPDPNGATVLGTTDPRSSLTFETSVTSADR